MVLAPLRPLQAAQLEALGPFSRVQEAHAQPPVTVGVLTAAPGWLGIRTDSGSRTSCAPTATPSNPVAITAAARTDTHVAAIYPDTTATSIATTAGKCEEGDDGVSEGSCANVPPLPIVVRAFTLSATSPVACFDRNDWGQMVTGGPPKSRMGSVGATSLYYTSEKRTQPVTKNQI